ncbi:MAG TPA: NAD-dependent epimerase/dehydratase family protein [Caldilineaceae bacterium]|nr:NAD-dependent epimerase/dehydratase family protein [Caldilineaceae bacterium]
MPNRKVLVTGASGLIASLLLPALRERYDLTLLDVRETDRHGNRVEGIQIADLTERNRDAYRHFFRGIDAVVHLGFVRAQDENDPDQRFAAEFANVQMAYNVYQVSWEEGVRRVVVASSNHAADYYEPLILQHKMDYVDPHMRALSDNYYGWAKEAYEHLGFVFAVGKIHGELTQGIQSAISGHGGATIFDRTRGRQLENVQIRIGGPRETDVANCPKGDLTCVRRALGAYISQRDMAQLFIKSIETEDIRDEHGVPFQIFYGVSNNSHAFWSIANARKIIGYEPQDNSEIKFHDLIAEHIRAAQSRVKES